jgi:predicted transport protein
MKNLFATLQQKIIALDGNILIKPLPTYFSFKLQYIDSSWDFEDEEIKRIHENYSKQQKAYINKPILSKQQLEEEIRSLNQTIQTHLNTIQTLNEQMIAIYVLNNNSFPS